MRHFFSGDAVGCKSREKPRRDRKTVRTTQHAETLAVVLFRTCRSMSYPQYKIRRISNCASRSTSDHSPPDAATERGRTRIMPCAYSFSAQASQPAPAPSATSTVPIVECSFEISLIRNNNNANRIGWIMYATACANSRWRFGEVNLADFAVLFQITISGWNFSGRRNRRAVWVRGASYTFMSTIAHLRV